MRLRYESKRWGMGGLAAILVACSLSVMATKGEAFYDAFPSGYSYESGPAGSSYPWGGDDFESYWDGELVECVSNMSRRSHLDVTSGCLYSKYAGSWRRGWTSTHNFRAVAIGWKNGKKIKWTDQVAAYRAYIDSWQSGATGYHGLHIFGRYRTSDDLYVASIRHDGKATIKRKWDGVYTTLAQVDIPSQFLDSSGRPKTGEWFRLKLSIIDDSINFYLNGTFLCSATSGTFSWGTTGIRTDYANVYLDDWELVY